MIWVISGAVILMVAVLFLGSIWTGGELIQMWMRAIPR